jgi:hypothetical protein
VRVPRLLLPCLLAAALAAAGAQAAAPPWYVRAEALAHRPATAQEQQLAAIATVLARRTVKIRCGETQAANVGGFTPSVNAHAADYAVVRTDLCTALADFAAQPDAAPTPKTAQALQAVSHESFHLWGTPVEAKAECYGLQNIWYVAHRLGASLVASQALARAYWEQNYPLQRKEAPAYWSAECRDGGKLDLRPRSSAWPS